MAMPVHTEGSSRANHTGFVTQGSPDSDSHVCSQTVMANSVLEVPIM